MINPGDRERLAQFISIAEKAKNSKFRKETSNLGFNLEFEAGKGIEQKLVGFEEDYFRSALMDTRKLLLKKDGVEIPVVCDLIIANTANQLIIKNIQGCKAIYTKLMTEPALAMIINGTPENASDMVKKWLYGHYIHEQKENAESLNSLGVATLFHKYNFTITITRLVDLSMFIAWQAKLVLGIKP